MAGDIDLARLVVSMEAQSAKYLKDLEKSRNETQKWRSKVSKNVSSVASTFRNLAVAAGIGLLTKKIIAATAQQEKAVAQLEAGWKSTGGVVGRSVDQMIDHAGRLQKVSLFGDEQIMEAQSQLLTFTGIVGDEFDATTEAVLNLSARMGTDLKSSAIQLGKALNDPIANLSALSRSGIQFNDTQKDMIKGLVESGRLADAQKVILAELERQFGGSTKAARDTFGGALTSLGNAFGDLLEGTGGKGGLNDARLAIEDLITLLQDPQFVSGMNTFFSTAITGFTKLAGLIGMVARGWGLIIDKVKEFSASGAMVGPFGGFNRRNAIDLADKDKPMRINVNQGQPQQQGVPGIPDDKLASNFEKIQASLRTETEAFQQAYEERMAIIDAFEQRFTDRQAEAVEARTRLIDERNQWLIQQETQGAETRIRLEKDILAAKLDFGAQALDMLANNLKEGSALQKLALGLSKALAVAQIILSTESAAMAALAPPPLGMGPILGLPYASTIRGLGYASAALAGAVALQSFEGGGFTGSGSRSGGLDGHGGFMAMLHPNEMVTDLHGRGGGGVTIIQNNDIDARGADPSVISNFHTALDRNRELTIATIRQMKAEGKI